MDGATEDQESLMCRFSKDRWLIARDKECEDAEHRWIFGKLVNGAITSDVQALEVKFDEEVKSDQECRMLTWRTL